MGGLPETASVRLRIEATGKRQKAKGKRQKAKVGRCAARSLFPCATSGLTLQEGAAAGFALKGAVVDDDVAAGDYRAGVALHFEAFEHRVVDAHVMGRGADG